MSPQGLFLGAVARWPLSCPKSLLSPPASPSRAPVAQSCRLGSAQPELAGPGRAGRPADPPPPALAGPASCRPGTFGGPRAVRTQGREARAARAYLAQSRATPEQLRGPAGYLRWWRSRGPNQGTRSRHCRGGGEEIARNLLGNHLAHGLRGVCLLCAPTLEEGGGLGGTDRWALERCPLHPGSNVERDGLPPAQESRVSPAAPSQPPESAPESFPSRPGGIAWGRGARWHGD